MWIQSALSNNTSHGGTQASAFTMCTGRPAPCSSRDGSSRFRDHRSRLQLPRLCRRVLALLICLCTCLPLPARAAYSGTASASSGAGEFAPDRAIDGNLNTRWSTDWRDNEWWQFTFDTPQPLAGLRILWENAFAEIYHIAVSDDATNWNTIASVHDGDGATDLLFFAPVTTRHVRIVCEQRGTGWGNSIWELAFISPEQAPRLTASSTASSSSPAAALDGKADTVWRAVSTQAWLTLTFAQPELLSGLALHWAASNVTFCCLHSTNNVDWHPLTPGQATAGMHSHITWPALTTAALRIVCATRTGAPALAEIELLTSSFAPSPVRRFTLFARTAPAGFFPLWLARQQEFWTIAGVPGHPEEVLLGETGVVEPRKNRPALLPVVAAGNRIVSYADLPRSAHDPGLPRVSWDTPSPLFSILLAAEGTATTAWARVRYCVWNREAASRKLYMAVFIRPIQLNPVWQHGGFAPIYTAAWHRAGSQMCLFINGELYLTCHTSSLAGVHAYLASEDDVARVLAAPQHVSACDVVSPDGFGCAALVFAHEHRPFTSREYNLFLPLQTETNAVAPPAAVPLRVLWSRRDQTTPAPPFQWPDRAFSAFARANLAYMQLTRDGALFKPGPRNYNHSWMRDGAITSLAMLRYGHPERVRDFLVAVTNAIAPNGWVPFLILENGVPAGVSTNFHGGEGQEYDSQGQFMFAVHNYYTYTRDAPLTRNLYPYVRAAAAYLRELRRARMTAPYRTDPALTPYFGLLPHSNSHEGYFPARHSYWDDFWAIRGLEDAADLAAQLGHTNDAAWMHAEAADLRACTLASITTVMARAALSTIPGCVELADFDPTSTSIALSACGLDDLLPYDALTNTYARYWQNIAPRLDGSAADTFTPYEARNGDACVRLGQREHALALLRHLINDATRPQAWRHLAEVVHAEPRKPAYIGDMPHTWVGADVLNALRSLIVYERGNQLVLGAGLDPAWLARGVAFTNVPTAFGVLSYSAQLSSNTFRASVTGSVTPPAGFAFVLPGPAQLTLHFSQVPTNITCHF